MLMRPDGGGHGCFPHCGVNQTKEIMAAFATFRPCSSWWCNAVGWAKSVGWVPIPGRDGGGAGSASLRLRQPARFCIRNNSPGQPVDVFGKSGPASPTRVHYFRDLITKRDVEFKFK